MYLRHFNFTSKPFAMNPDPASLYASAQHRSALTMLEYAMESQASFCLLTGEIGCGKTTLLRHLIRTLGDRVAVGLISNTHARFRSIQPWALSALGLTARDGTDIGQYEALTEFFIGQFARGRRTLLILDEAQNLSSGTLEELRLLSNVNSEAEVVLQTMLVWQPELRTTLARPELTQLAQRIAVDFHLRALTLSEADAYIRHRMGVAGGSETLFQRSAIEHIHLRSNGVPRLINRLCDLCLVYAFADRLESVDSAVVAKVLEDQHRNSDVPLTAVTETPGTPEQIFVDSTAATSVGEALVRERA